MKNELYIKKAKPQSTPHRYDLGMSLGWIWITYTNIYIQYEFENLNPFLFFIFFYDKVPFLVLISCI